VSTDSKLALLQQKLAKKPSPTRPRKLQSLPKRKLQRATNNFAILKPVSLKRPVFFYENDRIKIYESDKT
jgi:hypothetical protein